MRLWLSCRLRRKVKDFINVKGKSKVRDKVKVTLKVKLSFPFGRESGNLGIPRRYSVAEYKECL